MGKQVAARITEKIMSRKRPHEGTAGSCHRTGRKGANLNQQGSAVGIERLVLPVIRDFGKTEISND